MKEIWKPVVGYEDLYEVSDLGRVRRVPSHYSPIGRVLKSAHGSRGYLVVCLSSNGEKQTWYIHVLVTRAFIGPKPKSLEVRHLDGNSINNALTNLEYTTRSRNMQDIKWHNGHPIHKLRPKDVLDIKRRLGGWGSITALAREYNVTAPTISAIKRGLTHRDVL